MRIRPLPTLLATLLLAAPAFADLPEPPANTGSTQVEVDGTKVSAEAWAVAKGHDVDAIVVARLVPKEGQDPVVETYESWSVDGKRRFERGDRKLGKEWEKKVEAMLAEVEKGLDPEELEKLGAPGKDLLERLTRDLGKGGSRPFEGRVLAWSISSSSVTADGRPSRARTAVITFSEPLPEDALTPPDAERPKHTGPVTPGPGGKAERLLPPPGHRGGSGSASSSGSGRAVADSNQGAKNHARVEVELKRTAPAPDEDEPEPEVTPGEK